MITNLELLGKIWGFLKYHHPEICKGNINWDLELIKFLPHFIESNSTETRDERLINWINKLGFVTICTNCDSPDSDTFIKPDHSWFNDYNMNSLLINKLIYIYRNRFQGEKHYVRMAQGVGNPEFVNENAYSNSPYPDQGFRLLSLYRYWNIVQYFYPYKYLTDKSWDSILAEYIPIFLGASDELEYEIAALRIIGDLKDTHANLWGGGDKLNELRGEYFPAFQVKFIEDKLVVSDYYNSELQPELGIQLGDIITHINGRTIDKITDSLHVFYPASNSAVEMRDISFDILRSKDSVLQITYVRDGLEILKDLKLYNSSQLNIYRWYRKDTGKSFRLLTDDIGYVSLKSIRETDVPLIKEEFRKTKGIIMDIRNYPSAFVPFTLGTYFLKTSTPFVKFTEFNINNPGEFNFTKALSIPKTDSAYNGKLIVLVNELTQSQAEYTAMAFRAGVNTTILGSTTAGADGNISSIILPGGLKTMISGIGVYYPNGNETQRVGIIPDVKIKPTIENGIKRGKDELLEMAFKLIEN